MHSLILGGARSGKSRRAEMRAAQWLKGGGTAVLIATAAAGDAEMADRIARHRADRALRVPLLQTHELVGDVVNELASELANELSAAVLAHSTPTQLVVVDCLTLWLTQLAMPLQGPPATPARLQEEGESLCAALRAADGPVLLVSNEIGLGVMPMGAETRRFVDALGWLHQAVAEACSRVSLMVAGQELMLKGERP